MFDLEAYFERIGVTGQPNLAEIHRAHVAAIPFENLDPHRGLSVSLEPDALFDKLLTRRRGGYCFEHNRDLYGFVPEPVPRVDVETSNWFTSTHPRSPFVTGLIASIQASDGTRKLLSDWDELTLTEHTPGAAPAITLIDREAVPDLLETHFGLSGFRLGSDGRVAAVARPERSG